MFLILVIVYWYLSLILIVLIFLFCKGIFSLRLVWIEFDNNKIIIIFVVRLFDCYDYFILFYRKRILWEKKDKREFVFLNVYFIVEIIFG